MFEFKKRVKHKGKQFIVYRNYRDGALVLPFSNLKIGMTDYNYEKLRKEMAAKDMIFKFKNRYFIYVDKLTIYLKKTKIVNYLTSVRSTVATAIKKSMVKVKNSNYKDNYEKNITGLLKGRNFKDFMDIIKMFENNLYGSTFKFKQKIFSKIKTTLFVNDKLEEDEKKVLKAYVSEKIKFLNKKLKKFIPKKKDVCEVKIEKFETDKTSPSFKTLEKNLEEEINERLDLNSANCVEVKIFLDENETKKSRKKNLITRIIKKVTNKTISMTSFFKSINDQRKVIIKNK